MDAHTPSPKTGSDALFNDDFESPPPIPVLPSLAVRVLNKCAYGPRPASGSRPSDVAAFNALGSNDDARLLAWVNQQLNPDAINDNDCTSRINSGGYSTRNMPLSQMWATHVRGSSGVGGPAAWPRRLYPCEEAACIKLIRAVYSERQLFEVMVDFWHSHFNVQGWEHDTAPVFMHYDRDVMRGRGPGNRYHALGNFRTLLEEVAKAPAMLIYLNNKSSRGSGFNENYARELCELHTLGAENYYGTATAGTIPRYEPDTAWPGLPKGYSDFYVYEAARCLTGWTMRNDHWEFPNRPEYDTGEFLYHSPWHDRAGKNFLASDWADLIEPDGPAMTDGRYVFDKLASHPGTAQHICRKLCRRFVSDEPPQSLVDSAATIWRTQWQAPDQIAQVLRHILTSDAFKENWGKKTKRPWESIMHALRATSAEVTPQVRPVSGWNTYTALTDRLQQTGHGPFRWPTPDGYPDHGRKWQAVSPLSQTWRTLAWLVEARLPDNDDPASYFQRIEQVTRTAFPTPATATAGAVVDFWIERIYGYAIAQDRRDHIVRFLGQKTTTAAAETTQLTWTNNSTWPPQENLDKYYTLARLRTTVSLLMMCPEFYHR